MKIWLEKIHLDLKVNWKLSRNETTFKENYIVVLETPVGTFRSEIAPNIRYGETTGNIEEEFNRWMETAPWRLISSLDEVSKCLEMVTFHSLRFGLESVLLSYLAFKQGMGLGEFLGLAPVKSVATSYSMPIMNIHEMGDYLKGLERFSSLKIKVSAESALETLKEVSLHTKAKLRIDANEGWKSLEEYLSFEESLKGMNVELIEQPFPASMVEEYKELKKRTPYKILADESIEDVANFSELSMQFHAINIKLMKTGSLIKARELIKEAQNYHMSCMIGCMIETSLGISYGMLFSGMVEYVDLDGYLLIKNEPFHLVNETEGNLELN